MKRPKKNILPTAIALVVMAAFSTLPIQANAQVPPPPPGAAAYSQSNVVQGTVAPRQAMTPLSASGAPSGPPSPPR
ncbi:MAG: hypothetical protein C4291_00500 [Candidatus Dadabacteria bacterium]